MTQRDPGEGCRKRKDSGKIWSILPRFGLKQLVLLATFHQTIFFNVSIRTLQNSLPGTGDSATVVIVY